MASHRPKLARHRPELAGFRPSCSQKRPNLSRSWLSSTDVGVGPEITRWRNRPKPDGGTKSVSGTSSSNTGSRLSVKGVGCLLRARSSINQDVALKSALQARMCRLFDGASERKAEQNNMNKKKSKHKTNTNNKVCKDSDKKKEKQTNNNKKRNSVLHFPTRLVVERDETRVLAHLLRCKDAMYRETLRSLHWRRSDPMRSRLGGRIVGAPVGRWEDLVQKVCNMLTCLHRLAASRPKQNSMAGARGTVRTDICTATSDEGSAAWAMDDRGHPTILN